MTDHTENNVVSSAVRSHLCASTVTGEPRWKSQFPDYYLADMVAIPSGWDDVSHHNDACPRMGGQ